jgi:hypothetical protein
MNKKIFIGSLIAVAILVFMSFTTVVDFQMNTTKSSNYSPLFHIRAKRAIDGKTEDLKLNYIGEGEKNKIPLPYLMKFTKQEHKILDTLSKMEDTEYYRFITMFIKYLYDGDSISDENIKKLTTSLYQLRNDNIEIDNILPYAKEKHITRMGTCIWIETCLPLQCYPVLWLLFMFIALIHYYIETVFYLFFKAIPSIDYVYPTCFSEGCH